MRPRKVGDCARAMPPPRSAPPPSRLRIRLCMSRGVAMHVEGDSLLIGRHMHHSAFSLADGSSSQSDEEEVGQ
jgi:hypothetical protein